MNTALEDQVAGALALVVDPCSVAAKAPLSVVDMGLVRRCEVSEDGHVSILLSPTAPSCLMMANISEAVGREVGAIEGVTQLDIELDNSPVWTPDSMTDDGRAWLELRRGISREVVDVRPQEWRDRVETG